MPVNPLKSVAEGASGYPVRLRQLSQPPACLWYRGRLPATGAGAPAMVAIVGSRAASGAGCDRAQLLASTLAAEGIAVVSGGAYGIDAAAHAGALEAGAATFAVLGCGADVVYPDRHAGL